MKNRLLYVLYSIICAIVYIFLFLSTMILFPFYAFVFGLISIIYWIFTGKSIKYVDCIEWVFQILNKPLCNLGYHEYELYTFNTNIKCIHCGKEKTNEK